MQGLGFHAEGLGFRVYGLKIGVQDLKLRALARKQARASPAQVATPGLFPSSAQGRPQ